MSETISKAAGIFCAVVILLMVPMIFINVNNQIMERIQEMDDYSELDRLSFEGERNEAITDNFYLSYEIYE